MQPDLSFLARVTLVAALLLAAGALLLPTDTPKPPDSSTPAQVENHQPATHPQAQLAPPPLTQDPCQPALNSPSLVPANPPHPDAAAFGSGAFPLEREPDLLLHFLEIYRNRFRQFPTAEDNPQELFTTDDLISPRRPAQPLPSAHHP